MIDMVPKAIMYTLVQYVFTYRILFLFWMFYWPFPDSPRMRCNASCSRTCTARTNWTSCSRRVTTPSADEKSANRWWRAFLVPARLSARCSKRKRVDYAFELYFRSFLFSLSCLVWLCLGGVALCFLFTFTSACRSEVKSRVAFPHLLNIPLLFLLIRGLIQWYTGTSCSESRLARNWDLSKHSASLNRFVPRARPFILSFVRLLQALGPKIFIEYGKQRSRSVSRCSCASFKSESTLEQKTKNTTIALRNVSANNINWEQWPAIPTRLSLSWNLLSLLRSRINVPGYAYSRLGWGWFVPIIGCCYWFWWVMTVVFGIWFDSIFLSD